MAWPMPAAVVSNTSPLFYLHCLQRFELLSQLFHQILIPPAVVKELGEGQQRGLNVPDVSAYPWVQVRVPTDPACLSLLHSSGKGRERSSLWRMRYQKRSCSWTTSQLGISRKS